MYLSVTQVFDVCNCQIQEISHIQDLNQSVTRSQQFLYTNNYSIISNPDSNMFDLSFFTHYDVKSII